MSAPDQLKLNGVPSPCISVCQMDTNDDICRGCYRTRAEIASWGCMDEADQSKLLEILRERRSLATGIKRRLARHSKKRLVL